MVTLALVELPTDCLLRSLPEATPRDLWPPEALDLASRAVPSDKGVGDVMAREFGLPGRLWKWFWAAVGKPCSCEDEQAYLNALYPFDVG